MAPLSGEDGCILLDRCLEVSIDPAGLC